MVLASFIEHRSKTKKNEERKKKEERRTKESSTFCSRYLSGIETQFYRDEENDDSIPKDEILGQFEVLVQKVRSLGKRSS